MEIISKVKTKKVIFIGMCHFYYDFYIKVFKCINNSISYSIWTRTEVLLYLKIDNFIALWLFLIIKFYKQINFLSCFQANVTYTNILCVLFMLKSFQVFSENPPNLGKPYIVSISILTNIPSVPGRISFFLAQENIH